MGPLYSVLVIADYPYVFGVYSTYEKAETIALSIDEICVIAVHDFIDSEIVGDILREGI